MHCVRRMKLNIYTSNTARVSAVMPRVTSSLCCVRAHVWMFSQCFHTVTSRVHTRGRLVNIWKHRCHMYLLIFGTSACSAIKYYLKICTCFSSFKNSECLLHICTFRFLLYSMYLFLYGPCWHGALKMSILFTICFLRTSFQLYCKPMLYMRVFKYLSKCFVIGTKQRQNATTYVTMHLGYYIKTSN